MDACVTCSGGISLELPITVYEPQPATWDVAVPPGWNPRTYAAANVVVPMASAVVWARIAPTSTLAIVHQATMWLLRGPGLVCRRIAARLTGSTVRPLPGTWMVRQMITTLLGGPSHVSQAIR